MLRSRKAKFTTEALDERLEQRPADAEAGTRARYGRAKRREATSSGRASRRSVTEHREILVLKELEGFRYSVRSPRFWRSPKGRSRAASITLVRALKQALVDMNAEYP